MLLSRFQKQNNNNNNQKKKKLQKPPPPPSHNHPPSPCTAKCLGVVCQPLNPCYNPGTCIASTGVCSASLPKSAGDDCDDGNALTKFDVCSAQGACVGISELTWSYFISHI